MLTELLRADWQGAKGKEAGREGVGAGRRFVSTERVQSFLIIAIIREGLKKVVYT